MRATVLQRWAPLAGGSAARARRADAMLIAAKRFRPVLLKKSVSELSCSALALAGEKRRRSAQPGVRRPQVTQIRVTSAAVASASPRRAAQRRNHRIQERAAETLTSVSGFKSSFGSVSAPAGKKTLNGSPSTSRQSS